MSAQTKMKELEQEVRELKKKSIELGEEGEVDTAHEASTQADNLEVPF